MNYRTRTKNVLWNFVSLYPRCGLLKEGDMLSTSFWKLLVRASGLLVRALFVDYGAGELTSGEFCSYHAFHETSKHAALAWLQIITCTSLFHLGFVQKPFSKWLWKPGKTRGLRKVNPNSSYISCAWALISAGFSSVSSFACKICPLFMDLNGSLQGSE